MKFMSLTEFGRRIGKSRTTVAKMVDRGVVNAKIDPDNGWRVIEDVELERYFSSFEKYNPVSTPQPSQSSHTPD